MVRSVEEGCAMEPAEGQQEVSQQLTHPRAHSDTHTPTTTDELIRLATSPYLQDALKLLRIRTTKHELIITPGQSDRLHLSSTS